MLRTEQNVLGVPADLALNLPLRDRPSVERESRDATRRLLVVGFVIALVVLQDRDDVILTLQDGPRGEGEVRAYVVCTIFNRADELVIDPD